MLYAPILRSKKPSVRRSLGANGQGEETNSGGGVSEGSEKEDGSTSLVESRSTDAADCVEKGERVSGSEPANN